MTYPLFFVSVLVAFISLGFGLLITWPICMVWAAMASSSSNKVLVSAANRS